MRDDWQCDSSLTRFEVAQFCRPGGATANSPGFQPREISFKTHASGYQFALTHGLIKKHQRNFVSLLTALSFVVLAVTGILAFMRPFSIGVAGVCYRLLCRRRSENVAPGGEWPSGEKRSARMITCRSHFRLSEFPKSSGLACRRRQGCSPTWISGLRFAVAF
jgi:hypothetical protein